MGKTSAGKKFGAIVRNAFVWRTNDDMHITYKDNKKMEKDSKKQFQKNRKVC